jgi:hypothetical protein
MNFEGEFLDSLLGLTPRAHDPKSPYFTRITGISQKGFTILLWPVNEFV